MAARRPQNTLPNWSSALRFMEAAFRFLKVNLVSCSHQNPFDELAFLGRTDQSLVQPLEKIGELMSIQAH
jgi:hypothetical protein